MSRRPLIKSNVRMVNRSNHVIISVYNMTAIGYLLSTDVPKAPCRGSISRGTKLAQEIARVWFEHNLAHVLPVAAHFLTCFNFWSSIYVA